MREPQQVLDVLFLEDSGDDPAAWYPALTGRRWPGAGDADEEFDVWEAAE